VHGLRELWTFIRPTLGYRKSAIIGFAVAVAVGILVAIWGIISPTVLIWTPLLVRVPLFATLPNVVVYALSAILWVGPIFYLIGLSLRVSGGFAQWGAEDLHRALRIGLFLQRHRFIASFWRKLIRTSTLASVFERLTPVLVPYMQGEFIGLVTHVARERFHDDCDPKKRDVCRDQECTTFTMGKYVFVVYLGDWPLIIIGRPLWYKVRATQLILAPVRKVFGWIASLGLTADKHLDLVRFSEEDIAEIQESLRDNEELLLVSGLNDAKAIEIEKIQAGILHPNWKDGQTIDPKEESHDNKGAAK